MDVSELSIQDKKVKQLQKKGLNTTMDVLRFYPRKYLDFTRPVNVIMAESGTKCAMRLLVEQVNINETARIPFVKAYCMDRESQIEVTVMWFHCTYLYRQIKELENKMVICCGTYKNEGYPTFTMPDIFEEDTGESLKVLPVYKGITGMSKDYVRKVVDLSFDEDFNNIPEPIPTKLREIVGVISEKDMVRNFHYPISIEDVRNAKKKEITDIVYEYAEKMEGERNSLQKESYIRPVFLEKSNKLIESLPYSLTEDQKNIIKEFISAAQSGKRVNALVQGDVGSGKTICAFIMMFAMADNGYQSVLMAPTGVLARQHFEELSGYAEKLGFKAVYLAGDLKAKERREVLRQIESGEANFVVGTHAVITKDVVFNNLGLTVVDEEHKFGVIQRDTLKEKASMGVHSISMSATPIPRSLAMAVYGDALSIYTISTMPNGRKPVKTFISDNDNEIFKFMKEEIDKGRQCYIVCPLITTDEKAVMKEEGITPPESVESVFEKADNYFSPYGIKVDVITGKKKENEKTEIIERFKNNESQVLIATTIIEVGVNVPNATVIAIMDADRFGLSGLHQLRGRVGRSNLQSYCILKSEKEDNPRLEVMCKTTDGFKIAEEDLKLRGTGEITGVKQSGSDDKFATVLKYPNLYSRIIKFIRTGE